MNYISSILAEIKHIDTNAILNKELIKQSNLNRKNEFLLILKPEIFISKDEIQLKSILNLIFEKLEYYQFNIDNIRIQNATYLNKHNVIAGHYGVINSVAQNVKTHITQEAITNFKNIYGFNISDVNLKGSLELLKDKKLDANNLSQLWKNVEIKRLAGGIYSGRAKHNNEELYIINGFHPPQLEHFIAEGRLIITMNISSNCDWTTARKDLIGSTYPEKASAESIRGSLFNKYGNYGFNDVSYVINSVHLSAGPLEGLIELQRFNSDFENMIKADTSEFCFGKRLQENFSEQECENILSNPTVQFENKSISLFDLTEEMNSNEAIDVLKKVLS